MAPPISLIAQWLSTVSTSQSQLLTTKHWSSNSKQRNILHLKIDDVIGVPETRPKALLLIKLVTVYIDISLHAPAGK